MNKKMSYRQAAEQLEEIVAQIENGELGIGELSKKVEEAAELVKMCKDKLRRTDADIEKIMEEIA